MELNVAEEMVNAISEVANAISNTNNAENNEHGAASGIMIASGHMAEGLLNLSISVDRFVELEKWKTLREYDNKDISYDKLRELETI